MLTNIVEYLFLIRLFNDIFTDDDKIKIISLNKFLNNVKIKFIFNNQIKIKEEDKNKWYFNNLTNVTMGNYFGNIPISTKILKLDFPNGVKLDFLIPDHIYRLTFGRSFNQKIHNRIPNSVTHLKFGERFNQSIKECIPNSVTHLYFGKRFNQEIDNYIPNSVVHLELPGYVKRVSKFPLNLKYLYCSENFYELNKDYIPSNIQF